MLNIVLFEPEIPPNTGNIIRLCANCGFTLHLIHPLGFELSAKTLRRAQLDYIAPEDIQTYGNFAEFYKTVKNSQKIWALSTKATQNYSKVNYAAGDYLLFGPETRGLPQQTIIQAYQLKAVRIPMQNNSRSLNLANSVGIVAFEAWRQLGFVGGH